MPKYVQPLIVGNWKMNGTKETAVNWINSILHLVKQNTPNCNIVVAPPFPFIYAMSELLEASRGIQLSGQDCVAQDMGPHTGDVNAAMLADVGCGYVILGHSERRADHGESGTIVKRKAESAIAQGLTPIVCVGETQNERACGEAIDAVRGQLTNSLPTLEARSPSYVIAYEPIWAIGTGRVPDLEEISEIHDCLRDFLCHQLGNTGADIRLLYGGSVKVNNAEQILRIPNVNGCLVGGASLKFDEFWNICKTCDNIFSA